ncbi:MAG: hypothetical protein U1F65_06640 [Verrucomicrobiota bacterium]
MKETVPFRKLLRQATRPDSGFSMSARQYRFIARHLPATKSGRILIIGGGRDTPLWFHCARGRMTLVENQPAWIPNLDCPVIRPRYAGKVGRWLRRVSVPRAIRRRWEIVVVDGPTGYSENCPGRQEPISWAARFGKLVFVHDYNRPWERALCDHYLGAPVKTIPFRRGQTDRTLAVFIPVQTVSRRIESGSPSRSKS